MDFGRQFEALWAKLFGGKQVPNSGAGKFFKLDIEGNTILWSLKATKNKSYRLTLADLKEAFDAVKGPGGPGGEYNEAMAICFVQGEEPKSSDPMYAVIEINNLISMIETDGYELFDTDNGQTIKVKTSHIPQLLRNKKEGREPN